MCSARTRKNATPKRSASLPKAFGTAREATSTGPIAVKRTNRIAPSSVAARFWSHTYALQPNQSTIRIAVASTSRTHVGSCDRKRVTCVIAKTKTRSKKSSSAVTSCSTSTARSSCSARSACSSIVLPYSPAVARQIVLLRGINLGSTNRIAMPALREALAEAGFDDVRTYLQSGNVVLPSRVARSKLWAALAGRGLAVTATARNWTTVTKLLELADED